MYQDVQYLLPYELLLDIRACEGEEDVENLISLAPKNTPV